MAMNKAEKKALEDLKTELALAWPRFEEPKPLTHEEAKARLPSIEAVSQYDRGKTEVVYRGWGFNAYNGSVTRAFFDRMGYRVDLRDAPDASTGLLQIYGGSNNFPRVFATEIDAYRAMMWEMSRDAAKKLRTSYARLEVVEESTHAD